MGSSTPRKNLPVSTFLVNSRLDVLKQGVLIGSHLLQTSLILLGRNPNAANSV
jgi:hypothetical protein